MKPELAIIKLLVLAFCLTLAACGESDNSPTDDTTALCADGIDNDSDSLIDLDDPGCADASDNDESDDPIATAQCADGIDNDSDSLTDLDDPGCADASDNDESDDPVTSAHDAARANSYDDAWESAWVANAKTILSTPVSGITKTDGKILQVGDSMTHSYAYGLWARSGAGRTNDDLATITWMHGSEFTTDNGWNLSSNGTTAMNGAGWDWGFVDDIFTEPDLTDAQFAVVMFNAPSDPSDLSFVEGRVDEFIAVGIVPVLSTIPPRKPEPEPHPDPNFFNRDITLPYNTALRALAQSRSLPIIDFYQEVLLRRPDDTWIFTLIGKEGPPEDGVHPSGGVNGYNPESDPYDYGGDPSTHTTGEATLNSGYLLRTWLTVQKLKEIKQKVVD